MQVANQNWARAERLLLCDLLTRIGPDAPTLCQGWTTGDLAAHLVTRERRPDAGPGLVVPLLAGHTERVQRKITKRGDTWAVVTLEDLDGAIEVLMFPSTYQLAGTLLAEDAILTVKGRLSRSKDTPEIRGEEVTVPDLDDGPSGPVVVNLPATRVTQPVVDQLVEVLGPDDGAWAAALLSVTPEGTFEHGSSTLQLLSDPDDPERWESVRHRLLDARSERARPARDDKVVAAWNGLAISGLLDAGRLLGVPAYLDAAVRIGEFLAEVHLRDGRLLRVSRDGVAGVHAGVLEDHGCVATA